MPEDKENGQLRELGKRIDKAKEGIREEEAKAPGAMHVSVDLLAGVLVGSFVGYNVDKWLDTLPVFFITCFFLGIAGAVRNILRSVKRSGESDLKD